MSSQTKINPDLQEERDKVPFNIDEFTNFYHGGVEKVERKRFLENYILSDPELKSDVIDLSYLSHKEKYEESIRRATIVLRKVRKLQSEGWNENDLYSEVIHGMPMSAVLKAGNPFITHFGMFVPTLRTLGTPEQQAEWVERAWKCNVTGSYVQTELGHGTFVRGLETTATYDPQAQEFVIHSPSVSAYKWWPGGLGHTVNHSVVFAQLFTLGKCYGIQPFIVQLRDMETHKPLKGIIIGETGPKLGFGSVNNGFLGFDNVRIPLKNMLMRNAKVFPNGEFKQEKSSVLTYGIMTFVRVCILRDQAALISKAVTIACRYSMVRRQSPINPGAKEPKIIDHVTQQMKIFPAIAKVIVFKIAADKCHKMYTKVMEDIDRGDLSGLAEMHAVSCCLKSIYTNESVVDCQTLRLACGGHGYLNSSGFNDIYGCVTASQAYEGENTVMLLQTAKYLLKSWKQALNNDSLAPSVEYLRNHVVKNGWNGSSKGEAKYKRILEIFRYAAASGVATAFKHIEERKKYSSAEEATNQTSIELANAAELHCQAFILQSAIEMLEASVNELSPMLRSVLTNIVEIYAFDLAVRSLGSLLKFVEISSDEIEDIHAQLEVSLRKFRNNAIGIVDGFEIPDVVLDSPLGAYDGNVYERLLEAAKASPLNQEDVNKSFHLHLKAFMKSNL